MTTFICKYCNEEFTKKNNRDSKFCSKDCYHKWRKENCSGENSPDYKKQKINCSYCNKELIRTPYELKTKKDHFCDRECFRLWKKDNIQGDKNPNYKGGNIKHICEWCNCEYDVPPYRDEKTKFCSEQCHTEFLNKDKHKIETFCAYCNNKILKSPSQISEQNFCDLNCLGKWNGERKFTQVLKTCVMCNKEYYVQNSSSEKSKTCSNECRYEWLSKVFSQLPEEKERKVKMLLNQKRKDTKPEIMVKDYLINNNVNFIPQHPILGYVADFYLPDKNLIIEVFGDFWHANPNKYGNGKKELRDHQIERRESDKRKINAYLNNNYNLLILWECDIYKNVSILLNNII